MAPRSLVLALVGLALAAAAPAPRVQGPNLALTVRWIGDHLTGQRALDSGEVVSTKTARAACQALTLREVTTTSADETWEEFSFPLTARLGAWTASPKGGGFLAVDCTLCIRVRSSEGIAGEGATSRSHAIMPLESEALASRLKTAVDHLEALCRKPKAKKSDEDIF